VSDDGEQVHAKSRTAWRQWLRKNHKQPTGIWLVTWRPQTGKPTVSYEDIVEEALCFGWIDSKSRSLDDQRTALWMAPRRSRSGWSRPNKERVERLEASGKMTAAGRAVIDAAKANGNWNLLDDVENLVVPSDLRKAFRANPPAAKEWEKFPPSIKRSILQWIVQAKRPETRARRVTETAELAARGERANQWQPKDQRGAAPPANKSKDKR
jgi:uncharacterized protein YdeI (YjbR/CyaY-like superfamily)